MSRDPIPWWQKPGVREALDLMEASKARLQAGDTETAIRGLEGAIDYLAGRKEGKKGAKLFGEPPVEIPSTTPRHRRPVTRHGGGPPSRGKT